MALILVISIVPVALLIGALIISIRHPEKRVWPPRNSDGRTMAIMWFLTVIVFVGAFLLGVLDWNSFNWPASVRWPVGFGLVVAGNIVVWLSVLDLGWKATSGARGTLKTGGLYAYSRNPQYTADMAILVGWLVLSASFWIIPVTALALAAFALAPFAEEPWLNDAYGEVYRRYRAQTPRFLFI